MCSQLFPDGDDRVQLLQGVRVITALPIAFGQGAQGQRQHPQILLTHQQGGRLFGQHNPGLDPLETPCAPGHLTKGHSLSDPVAKRAIELMGKLGGPLGGFEFSDMVQNRDCFAAGTRP